MKMKWTQNWGLKIGSLVFAALLWVLVTNINDPVTDGRYSNIPVKLLHTELLTESDLVYEVLDGTDIIERVTVLAPRSVLGRLSANNIVATADINDLSSLDTISIKLSVNNGDTVTSLTGSSNIVKLKIEGKRTKALPIRPTVSGELAKGYILGDITTEQNVVRITGPESLINTVTSAIADTDITQFTQFTGDINTEADVNLYDEEGKRVTSDRIIQNVKAVGIKIPILEVKKIPIRYTVTGIPAAGYQETGVVESNPATIEVAGKSNTIKNYGSLLLPESVLDITGSTKTYVKELDIIPYLPEGIMLIDPANSTVTITVYIEQEESRTVMLRESRIRIVNMPEGYKGTFSITDEEMPVTLVGLRSTLDLIRETDISGEIDIEKLMVNRNMDKMTEGFYTVEVDLKLEQNVTVLEPVEVLLNITELNDSET